MDMIDILWDYRVGFLKGASVTFQLSLIVWVIGIFGGVLLLLLDSYIDKKVLSSRPLYSLLKTVASFFVIKLGKTVIPSIPILVLLYWFYYPFQGIFSVELSPFTIAAIVLSLVNIASTSYIIKQSIQELPEKYHTSALLCGLSSKEIFFKIKLPLIIRNTAGPILLIQLSMLHNSIFASLINVQDILWQTKLINSQVHRPIEVFTILALFFLVISIPVILFGNYLKDKYTNHYEAEV